MDLTTLAPGIADQRHERGAGRRRGARHVSAQRRRPAGDATTCSTNRGQSALQPRRDRGVRVRREPVRRDAGPVDRRAGERGHEVGHQHAGRNVLGLLPPRQLQRGRLIVGRASRRTRISSSAARSAVRSGATASTSSATTSTSASRRPRRGRRPYPRFNIDLVGTRWERKAGLRLDMQFSQRDAGCRVRANNWAEHIPYSAGQRDDDAREHRRAANNKANQLYLDYDARARHARLEPDQGGLRRQRVVQRQRRQESAGGHHRRTRIAPTFSCAA